jgi:hypothetical protein
LTGQVADAELASWLDQINDGPPAHPLPPGDGSACSGALTVGLSLPAAPWRPEARPRRRGEPVADRVAELTLTKCGEPRADDRGVGRHRARRGAARRRRDQAAGGTKRLGGITGAFADPDGYVWEVAHNPIWTPDADGAVTI